MEIFEKHEGLVMYTLHKRNVYTRIPTREIPDLKQEICINMWKGEKEFDPSISKESTYYYHIIANTIENFIDFRLRNKRKFLVYECDADTVLLEIAAPPSSEEYDFPDVKLTRRERMIFNMLRKGKDCIEIGNRFGFSKQNANRIKQNIINKMRAASVQG